jgi:hypothetical protein
LQIIDTLIFFLPFFSGDEWFAIPTSWYAHWLLFVGLPEDQWGQHGVPELVAASDGPSFEELAQRDEPPGRLATLPLLDDWGLGLRPDLAEDRDFSFVPRAFWEKASPFNRHQSLLCYSRHNLSTLYL